MEMNYKLLGSNIRMYRKNAGLSQEALAAAVDCSGKHIGQIENAKNIPSLSVVVGIANALEVGVDQLVYGDLKNRDDFYAQEFLSLINGFDSRGKQMSVEMMRSLINVIQTVMAK